MSKVEPPTPTNAEASNAPWMEFALKELGKNIAEQDAAGEYQRALYRALAANNPQGRTLLDWNKIDLDLSQSAGDAFGPILMDSGNSDIAKYLRTVKTDPALDKKGRSWELSTSWKTKGGWRMAAWCAAFVNWCLIQAGASHLGYATADAWLKFGMTLAAPTYGCLVIVAPSSSTGSTTGHVAFYGGSVGKYIWLLGGNQGNKVCWIPWNSASVRGYRWPAVTGDYVRPAAGTAFA